MRVSSPAINRIITAVLTMAAMVASLAARSAPAAAASGPVATALQVTATTTHVGYGGNAVISARLVRASDNAPLPGGQVYLQEAAGGWRNAGSVVTTANGMATAYAIGVTTSRSWTLFWPGNAQFAASRSAVVTVAVGAKPASANSGGTTLTISPTAARSVAYRGAASFALQLRRASDGAPLPGGRVYLQYQTAGGWANAGSVVTNANGVATAYAMGLTVSDWWSVYWPGNAQFPAARSQSVAVNVASPPGIRLTFYYPWFPDGFDHPGSHFHPTDGAYSTADPAEVAKQVAEMRYAGLDGAIFSWWGQTDPFSLRLSTAIAAAQGTPFKWAAYYEPEGQGNPSAAQIKSDLDYLYTKYANAPSWLHVNGKPVIFVWPDDADNCAMLDRWAVANADHRWFVVQKVIHTQPYRSCAHQPDAWHEYAPANRIAKTPWSFSVSPGFWRTADAAPRLSRSPAEFEAAVQQMKASGAMFQLVTTWNEWIEGTSVEPAQEWATASGYGAYVDALHRVLGSK